MMNRSVPDIDMSPARPEMVRARQSIGLSQEALGERVGLSRQSINTIERGAGNPSLRNAMRISRVLGHSVEDLFGDSDGESKIIE